MIYYYFGGKEQLYVAVLERAYATHPRGRAARSTSTTSSPVAAIRRLAELTFDHHESHPDFIRLVSIENIHRAEHIAASERLAGPEQPGDRADRAGSSSAAAPTACSARDVDAVDLHMMISAFCVFRVANRHTFGALFGRDLARPRAARALPRGCSATWSSSYLCDAPA